MFTSLHIQGNLISEELLQQVAEGTAPGQQATDFGLEPGTRLSNEIEYAWSRIRLEWKRFSDKREALPATDPYGTTLARRWMEDFFKALGFDLDRPGQALEGGNGQRYSISHTSESPKGLPVHIVGFVHPDATAGKEVNTLDVRSSGGASRLSPHSTIQEYLNVTNHLYGLVTNGLQLRLLRDSGRLVKFTYIEFDLRRMLEQDQYADFTLLYRLLHCSRFGTTDDADNCWLEEYYKQSIETGNRIRDGLSKAVKEALTALGNGFVSHPDNENLRLALSNGTLPAKDYYRELLRLVYRLLFLLVTEERDLVYDPEDKSDKTARYRQLYRQYYSLARLRRLSEHRYLYNENYTDLWPALQATFRLFEADGNGQKMGIQPLGGDLFSAAAMPHIVDCTLANRLLLECIRNMNEFTDPVSRSLVTINYRALDVEELGSVYEGLLDLHPVVQPATHAVDWNFTFHEGTDRKTTGSYYTRPDLVNELIKSALIPVIEERLKANAGNREAQAKVLIALKVCDPAAGSGHMLLAAARTIAWYLARVQSGDENPGPSIYRSCLRQVIQHCIYAVDYNPDAVELCKLALWLESHNSGKPLSFLDHKIRNGNSLVGVTDLSVLTQPLPDEAFSPVTGDDPSVCKELKKRNAQYRKTRQASLFSATCQQVDYDKHQLQQGYAEIESIEQNDLNALNRISVRFAEVRRSVHHEEQACNIWTAAFFKTYTDAEDPTNPTSEKLALYFNAPTQFGRLVGYSESLRQQHKFFHWPLEFPDVFAHGGFDIMLGNPPWEKINLEDKEFFETRDKKIAAIANSAQRSKAINHLQQTNPNLHKTYIDALIETNKSINFFKSSKIYTYGNEGLLNTYPLFIELALNSLSDNGKVGLVVPSGFFSDDTISKLFRFCVKNDYIDTIFDFENTKKIFPSVHKQTRFSLITLRKKSKSKNGFNAKFYLTDPLDISRDEISLLSFDFATLKKLNPNNLVCPSFKSQFEYDLNKKLFKFGVLKDEDDAINTVEVHRMINMSSDSNLFVDKYAEGLLPLYESKLFYLYDHRYSTFEKSSIEELKSGNSAEVLSYQKQNAAYSIAPRYFINSEVANEKNKKWKWSHKWYLAYRYISRYTNERTAICSIIPASIVSNSSYLIFIDNILELVVQKALINSLVFDFVVRSKVTLNFPPVILFQTPRVTLADINKYEKVAIISKALELSFTSWDIKVFIDDVWNNADEDLKNAIQQQWNANKSATGGHEWSPPKWYDIVEKSCPLSPFKWDEERRAVLKAELDAIYAKLYGLTTEELRYILDPQDVYGPDFPGETFRVLKEKEIKQFGEYRTRRLVLEAWERLHEPEVATNVNPVQRISVDLIPTNELMKEWSLHDGIYNIQDCSRITGLSENKIQRWFKELYDNQYEGFGGTTTNDVKRLRISFHGMIELVVIGALRDAKISLSNILVARATLKSYTNKEYPFATNNVKQHLKVAGKKITFQLPQGNVDLDGTDQFNLDFISEFFRDIKFEGDIAVRMIPAKGKGKVVIDPKEANGKPAILNKEVPVDAMIQFYRGPESVPDLMRQYDLTQDEVLAAVDYWN